MSSLVKQWLAASQKRLELCNQLDRLDVFAAKARLSSHTDEELIFMYPLATVKVRAWIIEVIRSTDD